MGAKLLTGGGGVGGGGLVCETSQTGTSCDGDAGEMSLTLALVKSDISDGLILG